MLVVTVFDDMLIEGAGGGCGDGGDGGGMPVGGSGDDGLEASGGGNLVGAKRTQQAAKTLLRS